MVTTKSKQIIYMQDIIVQYKHSYSKRRTGVSNKHIKAQFTKEEDHQVKQK